MDSELLVLVLLLLLPVLKAGVAVACLFVLVLMSVVGVVLVAVFPLLLCPPVTLRFWCRQALSFCCCNVLLVYVTLPSIVFRVFFAVINSEVAYLGYQFAESYGLTYKVS